MKFKSLTAIVAAAAAFTFSACGSDSPDNPEKPSTPDTPDTPTEVGAVVPTDIVYQVNPRFYGNSDCFKAITADLGRIADMGCNVVWLMPIQEPGELKSVGSPYCIRNYKAINPKYGTDADLKTLVETAHAKGLKVVLDWVANHTAWDHAWITEAPELYKKDNKGNIVQANTWADVAQLDYSNAGTATAMQDAMKYWVDNFDVDGFRCDYAEGVPHTFWSAAIKNIAKQDFIWLAETQQSAFYNDGFGMIYDWNFAPTMSSAFKNGKYSTIVDKAKESNGNVPEGKSILRYVFNHDVAAENEVDKMFGSADAIPAAYVLAAMFNGTPMIYSSMDVEGLTGKQSFFNYTTLTFSQALSDKFKAINKAFAQTATVRGGKFADYTTDGDVVCFAYTLNDNAAIVVVNPSGEKKSVKSPISFRGDKMTELISGTTAELPAAIELEPYGYKIFSK